MPKLKFVPIYEGADIEIAYLGQIEVGRVSMRGRSGKNEGKGGWIFWLPKKHGRGYTDWREEKSHLAARNALLSAVLEWLRQAGLEAVQDDRESPTSPQEEAAP